MIRVPNLIIPGFPKSGTSSLHAMLLQHPDIGGFKKEPHTYSSDYNYRSRMGYFRRHYSMIQEKYLIDASTTYMISEAAIERILKDNPNAKFIVVARDPIDRIVSHYNWLSSKRFINKSAIDEIRIENDRFNYKIHYGGNFKNYIDFSRYSRQIFNMLKYVPLDNVLFLEYETLFTKWTFEKEKIEKFLNLSFDGIEVEIKNKTSKDDGKLKPSDNRMDRWNKLLKRSKGYLLEWMNAGIGKPRSQRVRSPIFENIVRDDIEDLVLNSLRDDLYKLKYTPYSNANWQSIRKLLG